MSKVYDLREIYELAKNDAYSIQLGSDESEGYLLYGVKIVRSNKEKAITIYNTMLQGDYYDEVTSREYSVFEQEGWRLGVYNVCIENYKNKITSLLKKIEDDDFERPSHTSSLQQQLKKSKEKLQKIEEQKWKTIHTKLSAQ